MELNRDDLAAIAKEILDFNMYLVLGTADESGQPWVTPLYFSCAAYREFYWMSSPQVRHSQNIGIRPQVSLVVFDSQVAVGKGQAVYMSAIAREVNSAEVDLGLQIYNGRFSNPADHGVQIMGPEIVKAPGLYRLYQAVVSEHWVLDPAGRPDHRTAVMI
jgi:uncharacterized protein YhbP (UPF0306 family)